MFIKPMERSQGMSLIQGELDTIIPYLKDLQAILIPIFHARGYTGYEVGVDLGETGRSGSIEYIVRVFDPSRKLNIRDVTDVVKEAEPEYPGRVSVMSDAHPYPIAATYNLQFLEELRESQK